MPTTAPRCHDQRAARVPGIEGGVGLDDIVHDPHIAAGPGRQGPTQGTHHAGSDAAGQAKGVADRHHQLPDLQLGGLAEPSRSRGRPIDADAPPAQESRLADSQPQVVTCTACVGTKGYEMLRLRFVMVGQASTLHFRTGRLGKVPGPGHLLETLAA